MNNVISFEQAGPYLTARFDGALFRERIEQCLKKSVTTILDFTNVEVVSASFADECFGKMVFDFDFEDIKNLTSFKNISPAVKTVIDNAYKDRVLEPYAL